MNIKSFPLDCRPREKALKYGLDTLSDIELLAIIIGSGTKENNVIQIASNLLSMSGGLNGLSNTSYQSLLKIKGIKKARALLLASIITLFNRIDFSLKDQSASINQILEKYNKEITLDTQEKAILVVLDKRNNIIKETVIGKGTHCSINLSSKDIFKEIFVSNGTKFYLIHTHPNSMSFPSEMDIENTRFIERDAKRLNIKFLDHFIVGLDGYISIKSFLKDRNYKIEA